MKKARSADLIFDIPNYIFLILFSIIVLFPFWRTIVLSFSPITETTAIGLHLMPKEWRTDSYLYLFNESSLWYGYGNTIFRTVVGTALEIVITLFAAYPLANKKLFMRNTITIYFLLTMFFSGGLIPSYLNIRSLGLMDSRFALILPGLVTAFNVVIMRNFIMTIDKEIEESAQIMGASYFTILFQIIAPLSRPVIATVALWTAVGHWNAWFDAVLYIEDEKKVVLQLILRRMLTALDSAKTTDMQDFSRMYEDRAVMPATVRAATTVLTMGPIILIYPFLQKYFVKGVMVGSLKG